MPYTEHGLPFVSGPGSHTSYKAARAASSRGAKTRQYLRTLYQRGPLTDHEARVALDLNSLSSINSIRNGAMQCGLVCRTDETRPSPWGGRECFAWALTEAGWRAVEAMGESNCR